ncbi:hypothetical protein DdX_06392 [Ditylenchus destructor]|uniref:Uncharacterized protein n=1 Tax=Ditylenchus destructor TaxID=166010 RepID=A0AAD4N5V4_9BILA|nr:hypothetical protein DdX_06392 [Ditylenchus destructor]
MRTLSRPELRESMNTEEMNAEITNWEKFAKEGLVSTSYPEEDQKDQFKQVETKLKLYVEKGMCNRIDIHKSIVGTIPFENYGSHMTKSLEDDSGSDIEIRFSALYINGKLMVKFSQIREYSKEFFLYRANVCCASNDGTVKYRKTFLDLMLHKATLMDMHPICYIKREELAGNFIVEFQFEPIAFQFQLPSSTISMSPHLETHVSTQEWPSPTSSQTVFGPNLPDTHEWGPGVMLRESNGSCNIQLIDFDTDINIANVPDDDDSTVSGSDVCIVNGGCEEPRNPDEMDGAPYCEDEDMDVDTARETVNAPLDDTQSGDSVTFSETILAEFPNNGGDVSRVEKYDDFTDALHDPNRVSVLGGYNQSVNNSRAPSIVMSIDDDTENQ